MHWIDLTIIVIFLVGFSSFGVWQSRFNNSTEDYFLGGRNLPWPVAMFSIVATETSVLTFISVPGLAYRDDWFFLQLAMGYLFGRILVSIFLLPQYFETGVTSIYEVIGKKFGTDIQKVASGVFLITRVFADGVRFLATAVVIQVITGWSLHIAVLIIGDFTAQIGDPTGKNKTRVQLSEKQVKDNAKIAFRSLKTALPKKVLKHENSSEIIVMS